MQPTCSLFIRIAPECQDSVKSKIFLIKQKMYFQIQSYVDSNIIMIFIQIFRYSDTHIKIFIQNYLVNNLYTSPCHGPGYADIESVSWGKSCSACPKCLSSWNILFRVSIFCFYNGIWCFSPDIIDHRSYRIL